MQVAGHERVFAIADEDLERENDEKTSAVHFLRFELSPAMVAAAKGGAAVSVGIDHDALPARGRSAVDRVSRRFGARSGLTASYQAHVRARRGSGWPGWHPEGRRKPIPGGSGRRVHAAHGPPDTIPATRCRLCSGCALNRSSLTSRWLPVAVIASRRVRPAAGVAWRARAVAHATPRAATRPLGRRLSGPLAKPCAAGTPRHGAPTDGFTAFSQVFPTSGGHSMAETASTGTQACDRPGALLESARLFPTRARGTTNDDPDLHRSRHRGPERTRARPAPAGHVHRHQSAESPRPRSRRQQRRRGPRQAIAAASP